MLLQFLFSIQCPASGEKHHIHSRVIKALRDFALKEDHSYLHTVEFIIHFCQI